MTATTTHQLSCPACRRLNEPPFLFCTACGHPLLRLGHWRVTLNLVLAFSMFLATYLVRDFLARWVAWDWTFFLFYAILYLQIAFWLVRGVPGQGLLLARWWLPALAIFLAYFEYRNQEGAGLVFFLFAELPGVAGEYPLIFYPALGALLVLVFVPALFRWARLYGWINSYRILAMTIILLSLGGILFLKVGAWLCARDLWPVLTADLKELVAQRGAYDKALGLVALALGRLLVFEIFIHASIRGYAAAHKVRFKVPPGAARESGFVRALTALAVQLRRLMLTLENTLRTLAVSLLLLVTDLARVARTTLIEIVLPLGAVLLAGWMLYALTLGTRRYVERGEEQAALAVFGALIVLLSALNVFLGCKTPLRWRRLIANQTQLLGWLLPNAMVLFVLVSLSLAATAKLVNEPGEELLPYRVGPITLGLAALLAVMIVVILARKWTQLAPAADTEEIEEPPRDIRPLHPPKPRKSLRQRVGNVAWAGQLLDHVGQVGALARHVGKELGARLQGKPAVLDRLEAADNRRREKQAQLASLEALKGTLDPETLQQLRLQYKSELPILISEHTALLATVRQRLADCLSEQYQFNEQLARSKARQAEIDRLREARILDEATARRQRGELETQAAVLEAKLKACDQQIAFLRPAAENPGDIEPK